MKNRTPLLLVIFVVVLLMVSCVSGADSSETLLEVVGFENSVSLTRQDLVSMSEIAGWSGTVSSTGVITPPKEIKGVSLLELADLVGGLNADMGINIMAKDGYSITMSYDQIVNGNFTTYDPGTGDEIEIEGALTAVVAYEMDGESISVDEDGPLRIFIVSERNNQLVDGHWSVKWVEKLELKPLSDDWVLYLEGSITEDLDRVSFESCTAPGCHVSSWEDSEGNTWRGVPLYLLAGRVDDDNIHEERAYNDDYAEAGYSLEIFAIDGYSISIDSLQSNFNQELILASILNGEPLGEDQFPLRLVGDGIENSQMIGKVSQIVLVPGEGVEVPISEPEAEATDEDFTVDLDLPEGAALKIVGEVRNQLVLTLENLEAFGLVEVELEHPKKGPVNYRGIHLSMLLSLAGLDESSSELVITASDGYSVEVPITEIMECEQCLVAIQEGGSLSMAMGGMDSGFWVKDIVHFLVR